MKKLLWIIPFIAIVLVYSGWEMARWGRNSIPYDFTFEKAIDVDSVDTDHLVVNMSADFDGAVDVNDASLWIKGDTLFFVDGADTSWIVVTSSVLRFGGDIDINFSKRTQFSSYLDGTNDLYNIRWYGEKIGVDWEADDDTSGYYFHGVDDFIRRINATDKFEVSTDFEIDGTVNYAADAQADDDYEVALPGITALTAGLTVTFLANTANTDGATLEITSVGDIDVIAKLKDQVLATGDILAGQIVTVVFDGSMWQMTSQLAQ